MQTGDFVSIDFVGRVKDTREIFDLTIEEIARKENVYNQKIKYEPITVVVDAGFVIKGLDETLKQMKVGEKKVVEIEHEKGFGERKTSLIRQIALSAFKNQNIDPTPGSYVNVNGINGRVISAGGGRITVDFNHPLAGKKLEYELEIKSEVKDLNEKVKSVVSYFANLEKDGIEISLNGKEAEVKIKEKHNINSEGKKFIADKITQWIKEIEKVKFVEEFGK